MRKTTSLRLKTTLVVVLLAGLVMGLTACKPEETELYFETVVKGDPRLLNDQGMNFAVTYESLDLMVANNLAEAQQIADTLSPERPGMRFGEIADIDYGKYLVVAAYFGAKPHGGFVITIEKITQTDRTVNVAITMMEPTGGDAVVVHPIHVVIIQRADLPARGQLSFVLWKEGEIILTREHFVP